MQQFVLTLSHCSSLQNYGSARTEMVCASIAFCRLEIIPPLLSGRLPYQYGKSAKLLRPDVFPRRKICQKCICVCFGSLQHSHRPLAGLKRPTSKGREEYEENGRRWKAKEGGGMRKGTRREMKGREGKREGKRSYRYFFSQVQALNYGHTTYGSD